jgi:hypothetical protein
VSTITLSPMRQTSGTVIAIDICKRNIEVELRDGKKYFVRVPLSKITSALIEVDDVVPLRVDDDAQFAEYDYSWVKED